MSTEILQAQENLMEAIQAFLKKYDQIPPKEKSMTLLLAEERFIKIKQAVEEEQNKPESMQELLLQFSKDLQTPGENSNQLKQEEQAAKVSSQYWKPPIYYDDDDNGEEISIPLRDIISELPLLVAITPDLPITDSLIMEEEHLNTISETKSHKKNKSSVKDLNLTPIEFEDLSNNESEGDMPVGDDFSSKNEGLDIVSISSGKEIDHLDTIPDSVQYLLNRANSIFFLIEEFTGKLASIYPIPPGIVEADPEEDIRLIENLLNNDSFPHSPEELNYEIPDAIIESFSPSLIPVEYSDSLMEEIDIFRAPDDSISLGIENDDYDLEGDVLFVA
ncbi:hypothetical protein Tco_0683460 [Tanacetum coccineum]|uniref:Uncharacterized protein n=1 Tax=Tanacetum coccineum TaxID=301880 RepID=A0ABQ4XU08_9ASTR